MIFKDIFIHIKTYKWIYLIIFGILLLFLAPFLIAGGAIMVVVTLFMVINNRYSPGKSVEKDFPYRETPNNKQICYLLTFIHLFAFIYKTSDEGKKIFVSNTNPLMISITQLIQYFLKENNENYNNLIDNFLKEIENTCKTKNINNKLCKSESKAIGNATNLLDLLDLSFVISDINQLSEQKYALIQNHFNFDNIISFKNDKYDILGFSYSIKKDILTTCPHIITLINMKIIDGSDRWLNISSSNDPMMKTFSYIDNLDQLSSLKEHIANVVLIKK